MRVRVAISVDGQGRPTARACAEPFEKDRNSAAVALGKASQVAEKRQR